MEHMKNSNKRGIHRQFLSSQTSENWHYWALEKHGLQAKRNAPAVAKWGVTSQDSPSVSMWHVQAKKQPIRTWAKRSSMPTRRGVDARLKFERRETGSLGCRGGNDPPYIAVLSHSKSPRSVFPNAIHEQNYTLLHAKPDSKRSSEYDSAGKVLLKAGQTGSLRRFEPA